MIEGIAVGYLTVAILIYLFIRAMLINTPYQLLLFVAQKKKRVVERTLDLLSPASNSCELSLSVISKAWRAVRMSRACSGVL